MADKKGKDDGAKEGTADTIALTDDLLDDILDDWPYRGLTWTLANEVVRLRADNAELKERCDVLRIELAQVRTGRLLLDLELAHDEIADLKRQLAAYRKPTIQIDVRHETAADILADMNRSIDRMGDIIRRVSDRTPKERNEQAEP